MNSERAATVDVVFPCLDEAPALPEVIRRVPVSYRVIVVDNGSSDGSASIAQGCGARVISEIRPGYGSAVHAGLLAATADIVAVLDCDGSLDPAQLPALVADIVSGRANLAVGRRRPTTRASWSWPARHGNSALAAYLRFRSALAVHDIGPVRVARRLDLLALDVRDRRSGYPVEVLLRAAGAGWKITEHDLRYAPRAAGTRSKVSGSLRGLLTAMYDMTRVIGKVRSTGTGTGTGPRSRSQGATGENAGAESVR